MAKANCILGLDIGTYSVKAVELTRSGGDLVVTGIGWERIPGPDMVADTVNALANDRRFKARRVVTAVSGRAVIVRQVNMAEMPPDELRQNVRYEADKYIPYDVEDVQLDCQLLGPADSGQVRVLLVAAKRQLIDEHLDLLHRAAVKPAVVDVDSFALANAFELANQKGELAESGQTVALVDIGAFKTSICIVSDKSECFTREVYTAGSALTDAIAKRFGEDQADMEHLKENPGDSLADVREAIIPVIEELGNEIRLSFDYYENQFERTVSRVFLSGGSVLFPGMAEAIGQVLEVETQRFSPLANLDVAAADGELLEARGSDLAVALGLAARLKGL